MLVEKIAGNLSRDNNEKKPIEYIQIDWYNANKKIHKFTLEDKTELGIRLSHDDSLIGLLQDDIVATNNGKLIVVNIKECQCIAIKCDNDKKIAKACYEIGNRHAPLFYGDENYLITPYEKTLFEYFENLQFEPVIAEFKIHSNKNISNHGNLNHAGNSQHESTHSHDHAHDHSHEHTHAHEHTQGHSH